MNNIMTSENRFTIHHDPVNEKIKVKDWLDIQLALHKRKDSVAQWLDELGISVDLLKRLCDLSDSEWVGLQILVASLDTPCVIYDAYDRYTMEEIFLINRILKKVLKQKEIQIFVADKRLLYSKPSIESLIKVSLSCRNFMTEKYKQFNDIHQEGDHLIAYFDKREKAVRFMIKCLNHEDIYYLEMMECSEKTHI